MKLKYRFLIREVSGQWVAVAVGQDHAEFNGMVKLNGTGAFLMKRLIEGQQSRESLLEALVEHYDVSEERAGENLDSFLNTLREGGLLTE